MPTVLRSAIIDAPADTLWNMLRDFNSHARWHPAIASSEIEGFHPPDTVGCVRRFTLRDGARLREQLLALSDREHLIRYCILSSSVPLHDYVAELRLRPITGTAQTFVSWQGRFRAPPGREAELAQMVARDVYDAGFAGLRQFLRGASQETVPTYTRAAGPAQAPNQAIVLHGHGGAEMLRLDAWPVPEPGPGEVRLRHTAIGVNFIDVYARTGRFRMIEPPGVPGLEAAGVVVAAGAGVALRPGERVGYACLPPGAYARERTMPAELVLRLPDDVDDVTAAAGLLKGMTAAFLLHDVHPVRVGEIVVIHAAAGGTGSLVAQWAAALGARVIGVVGSADKVEAARGHGCEIVLAGDAFPAGVWDATSGRGADVVFDGVGAASFGASYDALAVRGHLVSFGQASGDIPPVDVSGFAAKSARVSRPNYGHYAGTRADVERLSGLLFAALRRGVLRVPRPTTWPLAEAARAHQALESRATQGASVLIP